MSAVHPPDPDPDPAAFYDATCGPAWRLALALHGCPDLAARTLQAAYLTVLTTPSTGPSLRPDLRLLSEVRTVARSLGEAA